MSPESGPTHYRYRTTYEGYKIVVFEERWVVVKATECGYWIVPEGTPILDGAADSPHKKFVLKCSTRRYAYPDRQEAWKSFCIRRRKYERHLAWRAKCNAALVAALPGTVPDPEGIQPGIFSYDSPRVLSVAPPAEQVAAHFNIPLDWLANPPL